MTALADSFPGLPRCLSSDAPWLVSGRFFDNVCATLLQAPWKGRYSEASHADFASGGCRRMSRPRG